MGQVITVLSGKGGTGKTTFCANVAVALCTLGERVLLIDADAGQRSLDLVLGMHETLLFSYADVVEGVASLKEAAVPHPQVKNLRMLTAPGRGGAIERPEAEALLARCRDHFTYTLIDCPAGLDARVRLLGALADRAVVVSTPDASALRIAQAAGAALDEQGQTAVKTVVNRAKKRLMRRGDAYNIDQAIDLSGLPLLGVVPDDEQVMIRGHKGEVLLLSAISPAVAAYANIAERLRGARVPLFRGVRGF